jgi:1D-myo-inositol 3-kinase
VTTPFTPLETPDFLVIGHAARDLVADEAWRLGGSVAFAALAASRLGLRAAVVTSGPEDVQAALATFLPGVLLHTVSSAEATVFENIYVDGRRRQYLRGKAAPLTLQSIPVAWRTTPLILLAPIAGEVDPELAPALAATPETQLAATPQGWLRDFDPSGEVVPALDGFAAARILPYLRVLVVSYEDLVPFSQSPSHMAPSPHLELDALEPENRLLATWARAVPLLAVTNGAGGADLFGQGREPEHFPGYPAREVDPTGAGDVFAAALLIELRRTGDARLAMDFANRMAACSVERDGIEGIPSYEAVMNRFGKSNQVPGRVWQ